MHKQKDPAKLKAWATRRANGKTVPWNKGLSAQTDSRVQSIALKVSAKLTGRTMSQEWRNKLSLATRNRVVTIETRRKMSVAHTGSRNHSWRGGITADEYPPEFSARLKTAIRKRDKCLCQLCSARIRLDVHHIDYDKANNSPDNLISLCHTCHMKTNYTRDAWESFFNVIKLTKDMSVPESEI